MIKVDDGRVLMCGKFIDLVNEMNGLCQAALESEELLAAFMIALNNYQPEMTELFIKHLKEDPENYISALTNVAVEQEKKMN
jgi:hypothetical protein